MTQRTISREELAKHTTADSLWLGIDGNVYDITSYLKRHPGGDSPLCKAGHDVSDLFFSIHPHGVLSSIGHKFLVGTLEGGSIVAGKTQDDGIVYDDPDGYDKHTGGEGTREFGDHMANEGETSRIPHVVLFMYTCLAAWSYFAHVVSGCSVWTMPFYYALGMFSFYCWHTLAHSQLLGEMYEIHMEHHLERFPPTDFYGTAKLFHTMYPGGKPTLWSLLDLSKTTNIADGTDASKEGVGLDKGERKSHTPLAHEGPLLLALVAIMCGGFLLGGHTVLTMALVLVLYLVVATVGNALHMSFHVRNFHLEKYAWYMELRTLHYIHHLGDMKSNLAMLNMGMDGMFRSLAVEDPNHVHGQSSRPGAYRQMMSGTHDNDLPEGISRASVLRGTRHAGATAAMLGLDIPVDADSAAMKRKNRGMPTVILRLAITAMCAYFWFVTEEHVIEWVGPAEQLTKHFEDPGHVFFKPLRAWLLEGDGARATAACCISAALSEVVVVAAMAWSLMGPSMRPVLAGGVVFVLRLAMRMSSVLQIVPLVGGDAWRLPEGWVTVFVPDSQTADLFFSGRVAVAVVTAMELLSVTVYSSAPSLLRRTCALVAIAYMVFNISISLALQTSWSFDVMVAVVCARYATIISNRMCVFVDAFMP